MGRVPGQEPIGEEQEPTSLTWCKALGIGVALCWCSRRDMTVGLGGSHKPQQAVPGFRAHLSIPWLGSMS